MRKVLSCIVAVVIGVVGFASPINSMLGAERDETYYESIPSSAADYVQDGLIRQLDSIETSAYGECVYESGTRLRNLVSGLNSGCIIGSNMEVGKFGLTATGPISNIVFLEPSADVSAAFVSDQWTLEFCGVLLDRYNSEGSSCMVGVYDTTGYSYRLCNIRGDGHGCTDFFAGNTICTVRFSGLDLATYSLVRDGMECRAYINGVKVAEFSAEYSGVVPSLRGFYLYKDQEMCSYRFYDRSLSDEETAYNALIDGRRFGE